MNIAQMNEIFYDKKNFLKTQENFLQTLEKYMLTHDFLEKIQNPIKDSPSNKEPITQNKTNVSTIFQTNMKDSIFWCIYVAINGELLYQSELKSGTNMINLMMNEKRAMSEHFNRESALLKNSNQKITLAKINEIKCNLMTKPYMDSVDNLIPCSIYYGRPIYVYYKEINSYLLFVDKNYVDDDETGYDPNAILLIKKDGRYILETDTTDFMKIKNTLFHIQHFEKILQGASNYKIHEIRELYTTIFGKEEEMKKPEYYEKILIKVSEAIK